VGLPVYAAKIPLPSSFTKLAVPVQCLGQEMTRRLVDVPPLWHSNITMHVMVLCGDHYGPLTSYCNRGCISHINPLGIINHDYPPLAIINPSSTIINPSSSHHQTIIKHR
jgi:hypothetical protein